ncbi:MAG: DUF3592 domain-containing protein [Clostridiales bacterium]|nr:DUF3592 domain-containing protein [Clostridiales bacterium]MBR6483995.1 DUF3592 domain-containing protein [Clostridiales bacterium]
MSEDRFDREDRDEAFANNKGTITSWKQLIIVVGGFFGFLFVIGIVSAIPGAQWLLGILVGLLFLGTGITFLRRTRNNQMLPVIAVIAGAAMIFFSVVGKFFPDLKESMGAKGYGVVMIVIGLFAMIYPFVYSSYVRKKYTETVEATVIRVDVSYSRSSRGHRTRTYRPVYQFTYSGREYEVMEGLYSSGAHPMVGEIRELHIDEEDPNRFFDIKQMRSKSAFSVMIAVAVIVFGVFMVVVG